MTTAPTVSPEAFLADPAHAVGEESDPFTELERRVCALEDLVAGGTDAVTYEEARTPTSPAADVPGRELVDDVIDLSHELADLEAKHGALLEVIEEIRAITKKSVSKISLEVKAAIDAWANPQVPEDAENQEPGPAVPQPSIVVGPAHDAPVEEWREYARAIHAVPEGTVLDQMNRSQIRTMLGIEQPVGA